MNDQFMVSIIITTYKGDEKLVRAINSVLNQTYKNIEVIVVDDNGDGSECRRQTENIMQRFAYDKRVIYVKHKVNSNGAVARNTGIKVAHGKYLAFLDDDDVYAETRIEKSVKRIVESGKNNAAVYVGVISMIGENCIAKCIPSVEGNIREALLLNQGLLGSGSNIFIPKYVAEEIDGFDVTFQRFQDVEFMVRAAEKLYMLPILEILIIKDNTNVRFLPNYYGLKKATLGFLNKFENEIESMPNGHIAIYNKIIFLVLYAYKCNDRKIVNDALSILDRIKGASLLKQLKVKLKGQVLRYSQSLGFAVYQSWKQKKLNIKIRQSLSVKESTFIDAFSKG